MYSFSDTKTIRFQYDGQIALRLDFLTYEIYALLTGRVIVSLDQTNGNGQRNRYTEESIGPTGGNKTEETADLIASR
jgi:hypothetical protein